jgi:RNA polymerase sigma-70 factor (ECF subfamily)
MGGMPQLITGDVAVLSNPTQFSRLFDAYHGLVFRTAYRITGSAADAEDVLQTIFLRLVRRESGLSLTSEESYFRRAAVNAALDLLRARKISGDVKLEDSSIPQNDEARNREMRECLRRAFAQLTPRSAEIFALRYLEDFSNQEIAQMLDMSQVLVAVTLHRARRRLQKEIRAYFGGKL